MELTDLEINTEIAKIIGFDFMLAGGTVQAKPFTVTEVFSCAHMGFKFDALTDDALLGRLIRNYIQSYKYDVHMSPEGETEIYMFKSFHGPYVTGTEYARTALESIIEAYKD